MMLSQNKSSAIIDRFAGKGIFPYQMAFTLLIPLRNIFLSPRQLIRRLELQEMMNVMEVGPGPGYFSAKIAPRLQQGRLVLADIQTEMLAYARKRLSKKNLRNIDYYLCNGDTFEFPDRTFDRIFMVTVIGEVDNKDAYFSEFRRILKSDGILSISELAGDPDKISISELITLAKQHHFSLYKLYGSERNYTANFKLSEI